METLKITGEEVLLGAVGMIGGKYSEFVYIYQLLDNGEAWYVGSTVNPTSRLLDHLSGETKNTSRRIRSMMKDGKLPEMRLVDLTSTEHRLYLEALWIHKTPTAINRTDYERLYNEWRSCPTCYRATSEGTLAEAIPLPEMKIPLARGRQFEKVMAEEGRDRARAHDREAWAAWRKWEERKAGR